MTLIHKSFPVRRTFDLVSISFYKCCVSIDVILLYFCGRHERISHHELSPFSRGMTAETRWRLENVHWISIPVHIGDPIPWRAMFEKIIGYRQGALAYCLRIHVCPFAHNNCQFAHTVEPQDVRTWITGKWYIPQQKSPRKDKSVDVHPGMERVSASQNVSRDP